MFERGRGGGGGGGAWNGGGCAPGPCTCAEMCKKYSFCTFRG